MANTSRVGFGFRPVKHRNGSPFNDAVNIYEIAAGDGAATAIGDLVKTSDDAPTDVYPTVERFGTSGQVTSGLITGVVTGFVVGTAVGTSLDVPRHRLASTKRFAFVADAQDLIMEVEDGGTVPCTLALIGMNTGVTATAVTAATGASNMATGTTAPTTTNSLPLTIVGIVNRPDNEAGTSGTTYQKLLVQINQHQFMGGQTAAS